MVRSLYKFKRHSLCKHFKNEDHRTAYVWYSSSTINIHRCSSLTNTTGLKQNGKSKIDAAIFALMKVLCCVYCVDPGEMSE